MNQFMPKQGLLESWKPGRIIEINSLEEWEEFNIPHIHVFDSVEGTVFESMTGKVIGLFCRCRSMLMLSK